MIKKFNEFSINENQVGLPELDTLGKMNNYITYYNKMLDLFVTKLPENKVYEKYLSEQDGHLYMQRFINYNIKPELEWLTGIGIMESIEFNILESIGNGNIKI